MQVYRTRNIRVILSVITFSYSHTINGIDAVSLSLPTIGVACGGYIMGKCIEHISSVMSPKAETRIVTMNLTHNTITTSGSDNYIDVTAPLLPSPRNAPARAKRLASVKDAITTLFSTSVRSSAVIPLVGITGAYMYLMYRLSIIQRYLTSPERISRWFHDYDFNDLLLLEHDKMRELILQEFLTAYHIEDQKKLKQGIHAFIDAITEELSLLEQYDTLTQRIERVSLATKQCGTICCSLVSSLIPFSGLALNCMPSIELQRLFFINKDLKKSINERISRLHYYKSIFFQVPIMI